MFVDSETPKDKGFQSIRMSKIKRTKSQRKKKGQLMATSPKSSHIKVLMPDDPEQQQQQSQQQQQEIETIAQIHS